MQTSDGRPGNFANAVGTFSVSGSGNSLEDLKGGTIRAIDYSRDGLAFEMIGHSISLQRLMALSEGAEEFADVDGLRDLVLGGKDRIYGGTFGDTIDSAGGNDTVYGGNGGDHLLGDLGNDRLFGDGGNDTLHGEDGNDSLYGGSGDDVLYGDANEDGKDQLFGGADKDRLYGGDGNDKVFGGTGIDLLYGEAGNDSLEGGADADRLYGGSGADTLRGGEGNDLIVGGALSDILYGGGGADAFLFNTRPVTSQADTLADFVAADDHLRLDADVFVGIGQIGALGSARFVQGTAALDAGDRIIYDNVKGNIWFDADETGARDAVLFARVEAETDMTFRDFLIV